MLKIKDNVDLKVLEKFGFTLKSEDTIYNRGIELYYYKNLSSGCYYKIPIQRINWQWKSGFVPIRCIDIDEIDYELFPDAEDFDILFDLIKADMVEKVGD